MSGNAWLAVYCLLIVIFSLFGGTLPFLGKVSHNRLQFYLSASAGVMLGASFFHVMPDAMETAGPLFGWWMSLGVVGLFCIERFIAPHSHELDGGKGDHHHHPDKHDHGHEPHHHEHGHEHHDHRAAAPAIAGWMAVVGLTIHTFMNGVGLAGQALAGAGLHEHKESLAAATSALPALAMFLAIVLHKPADALAISTVLTRKGVSRRKLMLVQLGFALMVPVGAGVFLLTAGSIEEGLQNQLTGAALAFSSGTFLFIALSDLLPEVQFHRHDRVPLFLALTAGVAFMGGIALLEGHEHGGHEHAQPAHVAKPGLGHHDDHDKDHEHEKDHDHAPHAH